VASARIGEKVTVGTAGIAVSLSSVDEPVRAERHDREYGHDDRLCGPVTQMCCRREGVARHKA
jgi:hypothetical protein